MGVGDNTPSASFPSRPLWLIYSCKTSQKGFSCRHWCFCCALDALTYNMWAGLVSSGRLRLIYFCKTSHKGDQLLPLVLLLFLKTHVGGMSNLAGDRIVESGEDADKVGVEGLLLRWLGLLFLFLHSPLADALWQGPAIIQEFCTCGTLRGACEGMTAHTCPYSCHGSKVNSCEKSWCC